MPASQGSGPELEGASAVRRQSRTAPYRLRFEGRLRRRCSKCGAGVSRFGREGEQVRSERWPRRFSGEPGNVLVGLVELRHSLAFEELLGCDVEAVGVALDGLEQPGRWIVELAQHGARSACARRWCRVG